MKGAVNCQHSITDSFCALAAMVVTFNVLGDIAVVAVVVVWRRNARLKRRIIKASGIVRATRIDVRAELTSVLLYPAASMKRNRVIGCWYGRKRYLAYRGREGKRGSRLGGCWYK